MVEPPGRRDRSARPRPGGSLAVGIKNRDLRHSEALGQLSALSAKIPRVKGFCGPVATGIAARTVGEKEALRGEGFSVMDLADLGLDA